MARRADASLVGEVSLDTRKFDQGVKQVQGGMRGLADGLKAIGAAFAAWGAKELAQTGYEMARLGAQSLRLKESFEQLADAYQGNSQAILDTLKQASQGAISETNLILGANRAMMLGLGADAEQLGKLMEVAAFRARAMGISTTQAWDNIVTGIGRKSPLILDNLGIVGLKMDENTSKAELMAQVIEQGQKMIADAGGTTVDALAKMERLEAKTEDLKAKLGELWVKTDIPNVVVDFISRGAEGWINTLDYLEILNNWAAKEHKTTFQVIMEQIGPSPEELATRDFAQPENLTEYWGTIYDPYAMAEQADKFLTLMTAAAMDNVRRLFQELGPLGGQVEEILTKSAELIEKNAINTEHWGESWRDMPESLADFAINFAILEQRLVEGVMTVEEFQRDVVYVGGQLREHIAEYERYHDHVTETVTQAKRLGDEYGYTAMRGAEIGKRLQDAGWATRRLADEWSAVGLQIAASYERLDRFVEKVKRPGYGDYSVAEQFTPQAQARAALAKLDLDVTIAKAMERANKTAADDFRAKFEGANTIIAGDISDKVRRALGIDEPTRGGPLDRGDAPAEWWRRLPDVIGRGEDSPWAEEMRGDIAKIADFLVGPGAGEKVLADEGAMRAGAEAIQRFAEQFGYAGAAGAIELNAGVVTIDWQQAAAAMERETGLEKAVVGGEAYAAQQMGLPVTGLAVPTGVPGATAAAPGAEGGIAGSGYAVMAQDAQVLAEVLQTTLMPQLTAVNDFFVTQLNLNIGVANTLIGTDMPNSIVVASGSFASFMTEAIQPTTDAVWQLNQALQETIDKLERLKELDLGNFQPGSPTPFELGLRGINEELAQMGGAWGMITPPLGGGADAPVSIHLHVGAMLGREADAYRLANELLPYLNRARRVQRWD